MNLAKVHSKLCSDKMKWLLVTFIRVTAGCFIQFYLKCEALEHWLKSGPTSDYRSTQKRLNAVFNNDKVFISQSTGIY